MASKTDHKSSRRPKIGRPPGSTREQTISKVLSAARTQFGLAGYAGARMMTIADEAGVTHSSIYKYFPSKADLYQAAFDSAQDELLPLYLEAIASGGTLRESLEGIFRASADVHASDPSITPFLTSVPNELRRQPEILRGADPLSNPLVVAVAQMFEDARKRGEIDPDADDLDLVVAFIGAAMGIGLMSHGLALPAMDNAVEIMLSALRGTFFRPDSS